MANATQIASSSVVSPEGLAVKEMPLASWWKIGASIESKRASVLGEPGEVVVGTVASCVLCGILSANEL